MQREHSETGSTTIGRYVPLAKVTTVTHARSRATAAAAAAASALAATAAMFSTLQVMCAMELKRAAADRKSVV